MPIANFENFDSCLTHMMEEEGYSEEDAKKICGSLEAERNDEEGNLSALINEISNADSIITDLGLDLVSAVENPAQPSDWIMMKSDNEDYDWKSSSPFLVESEKEEEKRIAYAPALVPNTTDEDGDVVPAHVIGEEAHNFLKGEKGIDSDHNLIDNKGEVVESWILKEEREFETVGGESKTYPKGTWLLAVQFEAKTWERIQEGELNGFSIYGKSEKIELKEEMVLCSNCGEEIKQDDEERICGELWFNGTEGQRGAFGNGTEGRGTDEAPPENWWDDCISTIQSSEMSEDEKEMLGIKQETFAVNEVEYDITAEVQWDGVDLEEFPDKETFFEAHVVHLIEDPEDAEDVALPVVNYEDGELVLVYEALNSAHDGVERVGENYDRGPVDPGDTIPEDKVEQIKDYLINLREKEFSDREPLNKVETPLKDESDNKADTMSEEDVDEIKDLLQGLSERVSDLEEKFEGDEKQVDNLDDAVSWLKEEAPEDVADLIINAVQESEEEDEDKDDEGKETEGEPEGKGSDGEEMRKDRAEKSTELSLPDKQEVMEGGEI